MGVEGGAGGREDVQEGMNGGGGVTQVENKLSKILLAGKKKHNYRHRGRLDEERIKCSVTVLL